MYHHPFPTPATPAHKDPFQYPPPGLHPSHHLSQPPPHQAQRHPSHPHSADSSRRGSQAHSSHHPYSETDSEGDEDKVEKDKLELRREKNRVKQRNLRLRRANHIADLERDVSTLKSEKTVLQNALSLSQQRENNFSGWIHDLESALFRNGLAGEVEGLRRIWSDRDLKRARGSLGAVQGVGSPFQGASMPDPLSTLARAASQLPGPASAMPNGVMPSPTVLLASQSGADVSRPMLPRPSSFSRPYENPYPTPDVSWGSQPHEYIPDTLETELNDSKRKRSNEWEPYGYSRPPSQTNAMQRQTEADVNTLPPIQPLACDLSRSAPQSQSQTQQVHHRDAKEQKDRAERGERVSPRLIRISDLVSPRHSRETFWNGDVKKNDHEPPKDSSTFTELNGAKLPSFTFQPGNRVGETLGPEETSPQSSFDAREGRLPAPMSDLRA
ncbi:hypothetical protein L204_102567 [Cryptococcus depauperatus]|nr:hypothetical protein L204_00682 [Cryptococcus depauperatus CBS 7855]